MNKVIFMGRLTADAVTRRSQAGDPIVNFRLAVNRIYRKEGEPEADFFNCVAFGKTAERLERLNILKGTKLLIEGRIGINEYTDSEGITRRNPEVVVNYFEFAESKGAAGQRTERAGGYQETQEEFMSVPDGIDSELPFS